MRWWVLLYFFLEIVVTIELGGAMGGLATFLEILASALLGMVILVNMKHALAYGMGEIMRGKLTPEQLIAGNVLAAVGALLLIVPGFISDFVGIVLQFEIITHALGRRIKRTTPYKKGDEDVIDVEIIEHHTTTK